MMKYAIGGNINKIAKARWRTEPRVNGKIENTEVPDANIPSTSKVET